MLEGTVKVVNPLGLHARAAAQLVKAAAKFRSRIMLTREDGSAEANAKSMLSVLTLAASMNTVLILKVTGEDESAAFDAINYLFASGFGEN